MKDAAPAAVYLSDYTPPAWLVERVELTFRLHPTATRVLSRIVFRPNPEAADRTFRLDGETLMLWEAEVEIAPRPIPRSRGSTCRAACTAPSARPRGSARSPSTPTAPT
jgi:aminopeptidase N